MPNAVATRGQAAPTLNLAAAAITVFHQRWVASILNRPIWIDLTINLSNQTFNGVVTANVIQSYSWQFGIDGDKEQRFALPFGLILVIDVAGWTASRNQLSFNLLVRILGPFGVDILVASDRINVPLPNPNELDVLASAPDNADDLRARLGGTFEMTSQIIPRGNGLSSSTAASMTIGALGFPRFAGVGQEAIASTGATPIFAAPSPIGLAAQPITPAVIGTADVWFELNWAGVVCVLSEKATKDAITATDVSAALFGLAGAIPSPLQPALAAVAAYIAVEKVLIGAIDRGRGVYLTLPWPAITAGLWWLIIPTAR